MIDIQSILLARDFSPVSSRALRFSIDLARRTGATLHILHAQILHADPLTPGTSATAPGDEDLIRDQLSKYDNGDSVTSGEGKGIKVEEAVVRDVAAAPAILRYASENDMDVICVGTHGRRGIRRFLLGSVAEEVVRRADRPVISVRAPEDESAAFEAPSRILVPTDFSDPSREALRHAVELAQVYDARVDVLHVIQQSLHPAFYVGGVTDIRDIDPDIEEKVEDRLVDFLDETFVGSSARSSSNGPAVETASPMVDAEVVPHVVIGTIDTEVPAFINDHENDLVVMSTKGQTGLDRVLLGSVAEKIVRTAPCPVLTVKAGAKSLLANA